MDLTFEFGCSLDPVFIIEKMKLADVVCASEEIAQKLAPEEAADTEIMLREQAGIVSGVTQSVMDACFCRKESCPDSGSSCTEPFTTRHRGSGRSSYHEALYKYRRYQRIRKDSLWCRWNTQKKKLIEKQRDVFSAIVMSA